MKGLSLSWGRKFAVPKIFVDIYCDCHCRFVELCFSMAAL